MTPPIFCLECLVNSGDGQQRPRQRPRQRKRSCWLVVQTSKQHSRPASLTFVAAAVPTSRQLPWPFSQLAGFVFVCFAPDIWGQHALPRKWDEGTQTSSSSITRWPCKWLLRERKSLLRVLTSPYESFRVLARRQREPAARMYVHTNQPSHDQTRV